MDPAARQPAATDRERRLIDAARAGSVSRSAKDPALVDIPGYSVVREIHRGGQGVVFLAKEHATGAHRAVKVIHGGALAAETHRARFEREARVLARLNNPNIVRAYGSGSAGGCVYYVMDYVPGPPIDAYAAEHGLGLRETLALFRDVCHAVNAAHLRGVIHRDLKPSNVRVDASGRPQVLDFGLAKLGDPADASAAAPGDATEAGSFLGSLPWASPEQAAGDPGLADARTDVYALGVMLYQLVCGGFPYDVSGPAAEVTARIVGAAPRRPRRARPGLDPELETVILTALAKRPDERYQTAGMLARDLERYAAGEPIEARRGSVPALFRRLAVRNWAVTLLVTASVGLGLSSLIGLVAGYEILKREQRGWDDRRAALELHVERLTIENEVLRALLGGGAADAARGSESAAGGGRLEGSEDGP